MAPSTIRKAIGAVKDQTSISIAKVAGNVAPDLEVLIVKATSHHDEPADDKHVREILKITSHWKAYADACVLTISKRLSKTRDWIVALKALMLLHRLLIDGSSVLGIEMMNASRKGTRVLNMSGFRDEAHSNSWDHSGFVRTYALYLDEKLEFFVYERNLGVDDKGESRSSSNLNERKESTPIRGMNSERVVERLNRLLQLLNRLLACRPSGAAKNSRMVLVALYPVVKESFRAYEDVCEVLGVLLERFSEMEYADCVKAFDGFVSAGKMIDELVGFYGWCKEMGVGRSSEYPEVKKITNKVLDTLEGVLREKVNGAKSNERIRQEGSSVINKEATPKPEMNEMKALPPPENYTPPPPHTPGVKQKQEVTEDLVNLKDDAVSVEDQSNKLALALFSGTEATNPNWEAFSTAESGKADWELALVESASNLSNQKADLGGGFDSLMLNGMYDLGTVRQHVSNSQMSGGSASSVAMPGMGKSTTPVLALPSPDGTVHAVGQQDPFAASLAVPPPSYVQVADMEKKQHLLTQEQQLWQQYGSNGMQGQLGLAKIARDAGLYGSAMPPVTGMGQTGGYYSTPY